MEINWRWEPIGHLVVSCQRKSGAKAGQKRGNSGAKAEQKQSKSRAKAGQNLPLDSTWNPNKGSQKCWIKLNK